MHFWENTWECIWYLRMKSQLPSFSLKGDEKNQKCKRHICSWIVLRATLCWNLHFTILNMRQPNTWPVGEGWSRIRDSHPRFAGSHAPLNNALKFLGSRRWILIAFLHSQHLRGKKCVLFPMFFPDLAVYNPTVQISWFSHSGKNLTVHFFCSWKFFKWAYYLIYD